MNNSTQDKESKGCAAKGVALARFYDIWHKLGAAAQYLLMLVTLYRREIHLDDDFDYEQLVIRPTAWVGGNKYDDLNCIVSCESFDVLMVIKEDNTSRFSLEDLSTMREEYCKEHSGKQVFVLVLGGLVESLYEQYEAHPELERKVVACSWHTLGIICYELSHEFEGFAIPAWLRMLSYTLSNYHLS